MDENWRTKFEADGPEVVRQKLEAGLYRQRRADAARAFLAEHEGATLFPVPPRSFFRLSEKTKATIVLVTQIVAAITAIVSLIIAYLAWVSPNAPG